ncbi:unnamed protein product [Prunus armeniaca]
MTVVVNVTSHLLGATRGMAPNIPNGLINCGLLLLQVLDLKATCLHFSLLGPNLGLLANTLFDPTQLLVSWDLLGAPPAIPINILLQHPPDSTWYPDTGATHYMADSPLISKINSHIKGPPKDGLYPLSLSSHSSTVLHALTIMHYHAWHRRLGHPSRPVLSHLAPSIGFKASHTIFIFLYVDDIVVTGSDSTHLKQFVSILDGHFDIKDLGLLSYFLGLQVLHKDGTLHIIQLKYAHDLLEKANLLNSKPTYPPLAATVLLSVSDGALISNPTKRELVGSLQYFILTHLDIYFSVNTVAQYMSVPHTPHFVADKRILRYNQGTIDLGLTFTPQNVAARLTAYSDADWAGCPNSCRSTNGYVIILGTNLILWCSKK